MDTPDLYETYIRTADDVTYHPTNFREGVEQFLSENGYRLSINIDGVVLTLRKNGVVDTDTDFVDAFLNQDSVECSLTIRGHK